MRTLLPRDLFRFEQVRAVELSPDGEWLAYEKVRAGDTGKVKAVTIFRQTRTDIWIVRVSGGKPTRITSGAETATGFFHPMWAPDGERLAFLSIKEEEIRLYMLTDARYCLLLPAEISFSVGTQLACTAGTAFSALSKLPARAGDTVVVFGLGPVGLAGFLLSEGKGLRAIGVDVEPYRVELAKRIGEGSIVDARYEDAVAAIRVLTGGKGVAGVLECSGSSVARKQATGVAGRGATVVFVGGGSPEISVNFGELLGNDLTVKGNAVYSMASYREAVDLLVRRTVPLDRMVTHRFKIDQAPEAFALFDTGKTGKVVFDWG